MIQTDTIHSNQPERLKIRVASASFVYFLCGWGDGVTGIVLPYLSVDFNLNYTLLSLLFVASTCGFFAGTLMIERVTRALGKFNLARTTASYLPALFAFRNSRGHSASQARILSLVIFNLLYSVFFILMGSRTGFPSMFIAYVIAAFSRAFWTASINLYLTRGPKQVLGYVFAFWTFGSTISPLICQSIIAVGVPWSNFYFGSLVLCGLNNILIVYAFRPTAQEYEKEREEAINYHHSQQGCVKSSASITEIATKSKENFSSTIIHALPKSDNTVLRSVIRLPMHWAFTLFLWLFVGSETVIQGFIVSYLLSVRNSNPDTVGYVAAGFWGAETISRLVWGYFCAGLSYTHRKYLIQIFLIIALAMHVLIWFIDSSIENEFSAVIIGFLYGPIWPACLEMANEFLPSHVHMISMALLSAFATFGSGILPFIAGIILSSKGMQSLTYITVAQVGCLVLLWIVFPSRI